MRLTRFFARNLDVIAFAMALLTVGPLMGWWSVLVRRNIMAMDELVRAEVRLLPDSAEKLSRLAELDAHTRRQLYMISGESAVAGLLLVVLAMVLFAVARARRGETKRMQTLLQLTSHQLKTPIAGLRTLIQSLENGSIPPPLQKEFLGRGVQECDRLEHMVETILAFQRTVVRRNHRLEVVDSTRLIEDIVSHRRAIFPAEKLSFRQGVPVSLQCDPDAIHVVLENLLDNARKYGGGGEVQVQETAQAARWRLTVTDYGQGFAPVDAERLFEPFERGGGTGVSHGSGLGLYISRQLMRRMGGELTATSMGPGTGATFCLELPVVAAGAVVPEVVHG